MNILIVHNYYQIPGGEDTVVANEVGMLREHGHQVFLYAKYNSQLNKKRWFQKIFLGFSSIFNFHTFFTIIRIIKKNKIDIVHVHNTMAVISQSVYYSARVKKIPVIQTIHNFRLLCPNATFYRDGFICEECLKKGLRSSIKHRCYHNSKIQTFLAVINIKFHRLFGIYKYVYFICLTEFTKNKLLSLKQVKPERIFIKPNFALDRGCRQSVDDYFIFVGRLEKIKGVDLLLDVFEKDKSLNLKIVGDGTEFDSITSRINERNINNVEAVGYKTGDELNQLISHSMALIMCSQWYETFGMVIAEAYSNGVPVIVGNIGNIKDLVVEGKTGRLFGYNSENELHSVLKKFSKKESHILGKNAYSYYKSTLTPELNYSQLISIYEKTIKPRNK